MKNTFIFHLEWEEGLRDYPAEVRYEVYDAIIRYAQSGTLLELKPLAKMAFSFIKLQMDMDVDGRCVTSKQNGLKGGRPCKNLTKPKKPNCDLGYLGYLDKNLGFVNDDKHNDNQQFTNECDESENNKLSLQPENLENKNSENKNSENFNSYTSIKKININEVNNKLNNISNNNNFIIEENKEEKKLTKKDERKEDFEIFRSQYPGRKRGCDTEFDNFVKKTRDWEKVIPLLLPALMYQRRARDDISRLGGFVPQWKNLQTWINQRCWEEEEEKQELKTKNLNEYFGRGKNNSGATIEEIAESVARHFGTQVQQTF